MTRLPLVLALGISAAGVFAWLGWMRPAPRWPADEVQLTRAPLSAEHSLDKVRIYLDAGHGAIGNKGNLGALGRYEQDFTLSLSRDVSAILERSGHFEVRMCRQGNELVPYAERVRQAERWSADLFVSLHSDVRRGDAVGFSVLWSDVGSAQLTASRLELARALASNLRSTSLPAYEGEEYAGLYEQDRVAGVFVDRHVPAQRIFVLHKPTMPSVIIETHNAKSAQEGRRWEQHEVRRTFAHALANAFIGRHWRARLSKLRPSE